MSTPEDDRAAWAQLQHALNTAPEAAAPPKTKQELKDGRALVETLNALAFLLNVVALCILAGTVTAIILAAQ